MRQLLTLSKLYLFSPSLFFFSCQLARCPQIFDVLRVVGRQHTFSAGLVIGGKDFETEKKMIVNMNILVCTPGRLLQVRGCPCCRFLCPLCLTPTLSDLLSPQYMRACMLCPLRTGRPLVQHMEQTYGFECGSLKVLVLDEADRTMDMGFKRELHAILDNLPDNRQTLLFSATQTKEVKHHTCQPRPRTC